MQERIPLETHGRLAENVADAAAFLASDQRVRTSPGRCCPWTAVCICKGQEKAENYEDRVVITGMGAITPHGQQCGGVLERHEGENSRLRAYHKF